MFWSSKEFLFDWQPLSQISFWTQTLSPQCHLIVRKSFHFEHFSIGITFRLCRGSAPFGFYLACNLTQPSLSPCSLCTLEWTWPTITDTFTAALKMPLEEIIKSLEANCCRTHFYQLQLFLICAPIPEVFVGCNNFITICSTEFSYIDSIVIILSMQLCSCYSLVFLFFFVYLENILWGFLVTYDTTIGLKCLSGLRNKFE